MRITRRGYWVIAIIGAMAIGVGATRWQEWGEPKYQGRGLSYWVGRLPPLASGGKGFEDYCQRVVKAEEKVSPEAYRAIQAIRAIGLQQAIEYLATETMSSIGMVDHWVSHLPSWSVFEGLKARRQTALVQRLERTMWALCILQRDAPQMEDMNDTNAGRLESFQPARQLPELFQ